MTDIPAIFLITLPCLAAILGAATLTGRLFGGCFPFRLRGPARFYLSPVLGLSVLTIIASVSGRLLPMGSTFMKTVIILFLVIPALVHGKKTGEAFRHATLVSIFGIFCGASILGPLFFFGGFNAHNDAFTYLTHANWLQAHAFSELITPQTATPFASQISQYQHMGFRMGSSFLLAMVQSAFSLAWSYEAYPAVIIAAIAACCLAMGFPLTRYLHAIRRPARLALLAFPAFSLGGLVFGASLGFLPQTLGLALGAGLLFTAGPAMGWLSRADVSRREIAGTAVPAVVLLTATVLAYSELAPFVAAAVGGSGIWLILRGNKKLNLLWYMLLIFTVSGVLLNTELSRAFTALQIQSGAVVGSPVEWPLLGYWAHALGIHGGAWDGFQWTTPEMAGSEFVVPGVMLTVFLSFVLLTGWRDIGNTVHRGDLLPVMMILVCFIAAFLYFRFFVSSPFEKGTGQSWSQFKLSDWAHPFFMVLLVLASVRLCHRIGPYIEGAIVVFCILGLTSAAIIGAARLQSFIDYYGGCRDLDRFYKEFRQAVVTTCPAGVPVYLALNDNHHKFRQMAVYYLPDRKVTSDWMDDGYIFPWLPPGRRTQTLNPGDCVVAPSGLLKGSEGLPEGSKGLQEGSEGLPAGLPGRLTHGRTIGPFEVGIFEERDDRTD